MQRFCDENVCLEVSTFDVVNGKDIAEKNNVKHSSDTCLMRITETKYCKREGI